MRPILVIAGNYQQFRDFQRKHAEPKRLIYVDSPYKACGLEAAKIEYVGTFYELPNVSEIIDFARYCVRPLSGHNFVISDTSSSSA